MVIFRGQEMALNFDQAEQLALKLTALAKAGKSEFWPPAQTDCISEFGLLELEA